MSRIVIPTSPCTDPSRVPTRDETKVFDEQFRDAALAAVGTDVDGNQDPPGYAYGSPAGSATEGNFVQYSSTAINVDEGSGSYEDLDRVLREAQNLDWRENGRNQNVIAAVRACGFNTNNDRNPPWCAAFVSWALAQAGFNGLRSLSSQAYRIYGRPVDWRLWSDVRKNDIIVFKSRTRNGGHVGFVNGYNPKSGVVTVLGGNQSNNLKLSTYKINGSSLYVTDVRRAWDVPASADTPLFNTDEFLKEDTTL